MTALSKSARKVYVLGAGGIGTLVGSQLSSKYSVQFILRNEKKIQYMKQTNNAVSIKQLFNNNKLLKYQISNPVKIGQVSDKFIDFLIISVKTFNTAESIKPLLNKINNTTKILLIQNGMGVIDELYAQMWPALEERPTLYQGVISHGVFQDLEKNNTFDFNHAGLGNLKICKLPKDLLNSESIGNDGVVDDPIIEELNNSDILQSEYFKYCDLLVYQVEKFMVNCCINSVTSILDCVNHELGKIDSSYQTFQDIIDEALDILLKTYPVLSESKLKDEILDKKKLLEYVIDCGTVINGKNSSSMRQDCLNLRDVEIDYINGFVATLAERLGLQAKVNRTIQLLVKTRLSINKSRAV